MFITIEGIEGSGKTVQIEFIKNFFEKIGKEVVITKEPGGSQIGSEIRKILLNPKNKNLNYLSELLLYSADRAQHIEEIISPALQKNKTVICDRFFDSTTVYQGFVRGLDIKLIENLHKIVLGNIKPDLTLLFDLPAEIGLKRAKSQIESGEREIDESRFENELLNFHKKVREGYLQIARKENKRFSIIDTSKSIEEVKKNIEQILKQYI